MRFTLLAYIVTNSLQILLHYSLYLGYLHANSSTNPTEYSIADYLLPVYVYFIAQCRAYGHNMKLTWVN